MGADPMTPTPPPGFTLDQSNGGSDVPPPPPPGFTLDQAPDQTGKDSYWGDVAKNIIPDAKNIATGIASQIKEGAYEMPKRALQTGLQMASGTPYAETPSGQQDTSFAQNVPQMASDMARPFAHPIQSFREHPVGTALDVASVAVPAARSIFGEPATAAATESAAPSLFQRGAAKATSAMFGPSSEDILYRMKNPAAVKSAIPLTDVSDNLVSTTGDLQSQIEKASEAARSTLRKGYQGDTPYNIGDGAIGKIDPAKSGAVSSNNVQAVIKEAKDNLKVYGGGVVGPADKKAIQLLDSIQNDINSVGKNVGGKMKSILGVNSSVPKNANLPESTVGDIIRKLDQNINWADESATTANTALERIRTSLDQILKTQNPAYAEAMAPVDQKMRLMGDLKRQFNISSVPGGDWQAGTATEGKLSNLFGPNKSKVAGTLEDLKNNTGQDIPTQVKNFKTSQAFTGGRPNGARRVAFGTAVGTAAGKFLGSPAVGAITGSTIGLLADSYGGEMAAKIADVLGSPEFSKYSSAIENAAKGGAKNLATTQAALIKSDPDYMAAIGGDILSKDEARKYLKDANGDRSLARERARLDKKVF